VGDFIEVSGDAAPKLFTLQGDRVSIGRAPENEVAVGDDSVSWLHAVLIRHSGGWCIRDLGSSNGTMLNGERVLGEQRLQNNDELLLGRCRMRFRTSSGQPVATDDADGLPSLTRRERDVLVALCEPLRGNKASAPLAIPQVAAALTVGEDAVRFHLANLYEKFEVDGPPEVRLVTLATEAIRRGAV
jgi:predicted component of type VI protein secretion system